MRGSSPLTSSSPNHEKIKLYGFHPQSVTAPTNSTHLKRKPVSIRGIRKECTLYLSPVFTYISISAYQEGGES